MPKRKTRKLPIPACFTCTQDPRREIPTSSMPQANEFDARNWSITQVKHWVRNILPQYENVFGEECVSGMELLDLTMNDLKEMGIKLGHRKKIMRELDKLKVESGLSPRHETTEGGEHGRSVSAVSHTSPEMYAQSQRSGSLSFEHPPITPSMSPGMQTPISSNGNHSPYGSQQQPSSRQQYLHPSGGGMFSSHNNAYGGSGHYPGHQSQTSTSTSRYFHDSSSQSSNYFHQSRDSIRDRELEEEYEAHRILDHQTYQDFFGYLGPDSHTYALSFKQLWDVLLASEVSVTTCEQILARCEINEHSSIDLDLFIRVMKCVYFAQQNVQPMILDMDKLHLTHTDSLPRFRAGFMDRYARPTRDMQTDLSFSLSDAETRLRGASDEAAPGAGKRRHPDKQTMVNVSEMFSPPSVSSNHSASSHGRESSSTNGVIETSRRKKRGGPARGPPHNRRPKIQRNISNEEDQSQERAHTTTRGMSVVLPPNMNVKGATSSPQSVDMMPGKNTATDTDVEDADDHQRRARGESLSPTHSMNNNTPSRELTQVNGIELAIPPPPMNPPPPPSSEVDLDTVPPPPPPPLGQDSRQSREGQSLMSPPLRALRPREKISLKNLPHRIVNNDDELMSLQSIFEGHSLIEMDVYDADYLVICRLDNGLTPAQLNQLRELFVRTCQDIRVSASEMRRVILTAGDMTLYPMTTGVPEKSSSKSSNRTPIRRQRDPIPPQKPQRRREEQQPQQKSHGSRNGFHHSSDTMVFHRNGIFPDVTEESDVAEFDSPRRFSVSHTIEESSPPEYIDLFEEVGRMSDSSPPKSRLRQFDILTFLTESVASDHNVAVNSARMDGHEMLQFLMETHVCLSNLSARRLIAILRSMPSEDSVAVNDVGVEFLCAYAVSDLVKCFRQMEAIHVRDLFGPEFSVAAVPSNGYMGVVIDGLPDDVTTDETLEDICTSCFESMALNIEVCEREMDDPRREPIRYESNSLLRITFRGAVSEHMLRQMQLNLHEYLMDEYFRHSNDPSAVDCVYMEAHTSETWQGIALEDGQDVEAIGEFNLGEMIRMNSQHAGSSI